MKKMLFKEMRLSASILSYIFIAAAFLTFAPGYPILLAGLFTTLGIFYSFQAMRENNDIRYSLLLPVAKADIVKAKFAFVLFIEICSFIVMTIVTLIRMTVLKDADVYVQNGLMTANLTYLGFILILFALFNFVFVRGFFKTGYYFAKPLIAYGILMFLTIAVGESLHFIPGLGAFNAFGFDPILYQLIVFSAGLIAFVLLTILAIKKSIRTFEQIDL